jgi:hypothetical protein
MAITFGDIRSGSRRRTRVTVCAAVAEYTRLWGWEVVPGAHVARGGRCSCGDAGCLAPGAHPLAGAARIAPGAAVDEVRAAWQRHPGAAALLPMGRVADAIDVSERAGCLAMVRLERMGIRLGPVLGTPHGRALFFVAPGAADVLPELLYKMGWDDAELDLRSLGAGDHVAAPPSDLGTLGPVRWLRPPTAGTAEHPPEARLLLGTLAYACHRTRACAPSGSWLVRS